jgi:uncharacterized protein YdeI (YjbR/CyaY-like superfamily)
MKIVVRPRLYFRRDVSRLRSYHFRLQPVQGKNMTKSNERMDAKVDAFLRKAGKWRDEMEKLREIVLECGLSEELKWGKPCYSFQNGNVAIIQGFKEYCALMFFKGALLKDTEAVLTAPGQNSQAARQIRFTGVREIAKMEPALKAYIRQAVEVERAGLKVSFKKTAEFAMPREFRVRLDKTPALKAAFEALTPGRQRAYLLYFSAAKQSQTRESRIEKCVPRILDGKGLNDR